MTTEINTQAVQKLGYTVEPHADDTGLGLSAAYILTGVRGAVYGLIRNQHRPHLLFATNLRRFGIANVKGYGWFIERDGALQPYA